MHKQQQQQQQYNHLRMSPLQTMFFKTSQHEMFRKKKKQRLQ